MEKRKDKKGRVLHLGESQRNDGRYAYKYTDTFGKPQFVYSWKLVATDNTPKGKRDDLSLREKKATILKDIDDGINIIDGKMTLCELYDKYCSMRSNVRRGTKSTRLNLKNILENDPLGTKSINCIKPSDARAFINRMKDSDYAYRTISNHKSYLKASFKLAVVDDCVRKNPFDFKISELIENTTKPSYALTDDEEKRFLDFLKNDNIYNRIYDTALVLLGTGIRISELCGLTVSDLDFNNRIISIDHQLRSTHKGEYYINPPKSKSGVRQIPMTETVYQALKRVVSKTKNSKLIVIDGYSRFLFLSHKGLPYISNNCSNTFRNSAIKYNKLHKDKLPELTPHVLRHTLCSKLANNGMNPKNLQYLMGHSDVAITLNCYTHFSLESTTKELLALIA